MVRQIALGLFVLLAFSASAKREILPVNTYRIISDEQVDSIPKGKCLVTGIVKEIYSNSPVAGGTISNKQGATTVSTKEDGSFQLLITEEDSMIYFFHPGYGEIVCWSYDFKSQHVVEIEFLTAPKEEIPVMLEKPVIYLYAKEDTKIELSLKPKGELAFTYPAYKNGWNGTVKKDGGIEVEDKTYPYLFWEATTGDLNFTGSAIGMEGYYIKTDTCIQFLVDVLSQMGLNATEKTDFITYWGPRLQQHPFAAIQFFIDDTYDREIAHLQMEPKPDAQRRVYMLFKGTDADMKANYFVKPNIPVFERKGLTLVEWGGSEL